GLLAGALRRGGYGAPIVATEHGSVLQFASLPPYRRLVRHVDRWSGRRAVDAYVAVSDYLLALLSGRTWGRPLVRIHNGVALSAYEPRAIAERCLGVLRVGCAARL